MVVAQTTAVRRGGRTHPAAASRLPAGTWVLLGLNYALKAAGEVVGYLGAGGTPQQEAAMNVYEIRRFDYVSATTRRASGV